MDLDAGRFSKRWPCGWFLVAHGGSGVVPAVEVTFVIFSSQSAENGTAVNSTLPLAGNGDPPMPTYTIDPLHTEMLRPERSGKDLFRIDSADTPAMWPLTAQQVASVYPLRCRSGLESRGALWGEGLTGDHG
jgi:hypothetical protein